LYLLKITNKTIQEEKMKKETFENLTIEEVDITPVDRRHIEIELL